MPLAYDRIKNELKETERHAVGHTLNGLKQNYEEEEWLYTVLDENVTLLSI